MALSTAKAQAALKALVDHPAFKAYIQPGLGFSEPVLVEAWSANGDWAITWEEGPFEWAMVATAGGVDEEMASLGEEFGISPVFHAPVEFPKGVYAEPYSGCVLALYAD